LPPPLHPTGAFRSRARKSRAGQQPRIFADPYKVDAV
jgi:hypothetical protein